MSTSNLKENLFFQSAMNYESYLIMMGALLFVLTDESPEIRLFIVNQGLNALFRRPLVLESPALQGVVLRDTNDFIVAETLLEALTEQALTFEEQYSAPDAEQTAAFARDDALRDGREVPSGFPGADFFLTEVQAQLLFTGSFLEEFLTTNFYREHHAQNFDDKIFEHEPLNKFFDLLRIKLLVWQAMRRMRHKQSPMHLSAARQKALEEQITAKLEEMHGNPASSLKQSAVKTEELADMCFRATVGDLNPELR